MNVELTIEEKVYTVELLTGQIADLSNYLSKTNTVPYTPTEDYHPATKKYVDDNSGGGGGGAVNSVNGQTGTVVLDADDISDSGTSNKFVDATEKGKIASAVQPGSLSNVATSGDYDDLSNKPIIPTATTVIDTLVSTSDTSALSANQGKVLNDTKADVSSLATVATSGSYNDLSSKPSIPSAVNVVDNLTSTSATDALSAKQGKALQDGKQDTLVSGTSIKTVGSTSILGSGDIPFPVQTEQSIFGDVESASISGTKNLDLSSYSFFKLTLTAAATLTESGTPASNKSCVINLLVTGNYALTYPASWTRKVGTYDGAKMNLITVSYANIGGSLNVDVVITQTN